MAGPTAWFAKPGSQGSSDGGHTVGTAGAAGTQLCTAGTSSNIRFNPALPAEAGAGCSLPHFLGVRPGRKRRRGCTVNNLCTMNRQSGALGPGRPGRRM